MMKSLFPVLFVALATFAFASDANAQIVTDGGFEAGAGSGAWMESSTFFGTPLCTVALCGNGGGTGPNDGEWWAWFGGIAAQESAAVAQQTMSFPNGGPLVLSFAYEKPAVSGDANDVLEVLIDGNVVWSDDGAAGDFVGYQTETVDISAFADGATHDLAFDSVFSGQGVTNFFVDDVSIVPEPSGLVLAFGMLCLFGIRRR